MKSTVPLTRLDLGDAKWNQAVLARNLLDGERYPQAHFVSTRVEPVDAQHARVFGTLTLHGVSQEIVLEVSLNQLKRHPLPPFHRTAGFSATATLSRAAFGIDAWKSVIGDTVELRIEARPSARARPTTASSRPPRPPPHRQGRHPMSLRNPVDRWGGVSQTLHWLIALLILVLGIVGLTMGELPKTPKYFWVYTAHKSLGLSVLALVIARLAWRVFAGAPQPVAGTPHWQERIASATHWLLYVLIFAVPLSGWLYDSASGLRPFRWFDQFEVPKLSAPDEGVRAVAHFLHEWGFWLLVAVVLAHAGAAFYHHLFQRDATLARMLPRGWLTPQDLEENPRCPPSSLPRPPWPHHWWRCSPARQRLPPTMCRPPVPPWCSPASTRARPSPVPSPASTPN